MHLLCLTFKRFWLRSTQALKVFVCVEAEQVVVFTLLKLGTGCMAIFYLIDVRCMM